MAEKTKFVAIAEPSIHDIWHNWFKGDPANGVPSGTASLQEKIAVRDGKSPLPPGCTIWFDCNPTFDPAVKSREAAGEAFVPWPDWTFELLSKDGAVIKTGVLGEESYAVDGFVSIQSPDREEGKYRHSMGYAPIIGFDGADSEKCQLRVTVRAGELSSSPLLFPWVSRK